MIVHGVIDATSFITLPTLEMGVCVFSAALGILFTRLAWRGHIAVRRTGRHRRVGTRRLLPPDTQVTAVLDDRTWRGVVERPTTSTDRRSGVFPVRFPFGVRLMCTDDVTVVIDSRLVGAR